MTTTTIKRPVLFCGENPGMMLYAPNTNDVVGVVSYWHCTYSRFGSGNALVLWVDSQAALPTSHGTGGIFTDNLPLAQMLVETLTQHFPEFERVPLMTLPYMPAECGHTTDGMHSYTVTCTTDQKHLLVRWSDPLDQKLIIWPQFPAGPHVFDLTTVICPCRHGAIVVNGQQVAGEVKVAEGKPSSSAFLGLAETWIGPVPSVPKP